MTKRITPMPLTDTTIRNGKPREKPIRLFDSGGLYVILRRPAASWWRIKYRVSGKGEPSPLASTPPWG